MSISDLPAHRSNLITILEGKEKGIKQGRKEGMKEGKEKKTVTSLSKIFLELDSLSTSYICDGLLRPVVLSLFFTTSGRVICEKRTGRSLQALTSWKDGKRRRAKTITLRKHFTPSGLGANITMVIFRTITEKLLQERRAHKGTSEKRQCQI